MAIDMENDRTLIEAVIEPLPPLKRLEVMWRDLEARADPCVFLSWHWIGAWLMESDARPALLVARRGDLVVALALIGKGPAPSWPWKRQRFHLNQTGIPDVDCVYIEYNDILLDRAHAVMARADCMATLADYCGAGNRVRRPEFLWAASPLPSECMPSSKDLTATKTKVSPSPYVDLDAVRTTGRDYTALLSANTRHQIKRSLRLYEMNGEMKVERPSTIQQGLDWLSRLRHLHQERWMARGQPGAFARPIFARFVERLLEQGQPNGVVDLLRVSAGASEIGYLYNLIHGDRVSNYQSGFRFGHSNRHKPGLVAHTLAIQHYANDNSRLHKYSFLAGASQYKGSLSTGSEELSWYTYTLGRNLMGRMTAIGTLSTRQSR